MPARPARPASLASLASLALLALLALPACSESEPQPIELVTRDDFWGDNEVLAGGGASPFLAYSRDTSTWTSSVRLARHDAARPDELEVLGDVSGGTLIGVQESLAVLERYDGLAVIDLASPDLTTRTVPGPLGTERVALSGRWLLAASGTTLTLLDLDLPGQVGGFTAAAPVTAVLATQGTFLAFTTTGYVHVTPDPISPVFAPVTDASLRNFRSAFADGTAGIVAGPSLTLGRSRVVRLDLASPETPVALRSHEVPAPYAFFAWDGASTSVIATKDEYGSVHEGYVVHEDGDAFTSAGIPLPRWWRDPNFIAAHQGRLFALSTEGLGLYRINR